MKHSELIWTVLRSRKRDLGRKEEKPNWIHQAEGRGGGGSKKRKIISWKRGRLRSSERDQRKARKNNRRGKRSYPVASNVSKESPEKGQGNTAQRVKSDGEKPTSAAP